MVSVGELVKVQLSVFDVDGITPMIGLSDSAFGKLLFIDDAASANPLTVNEVGAGVYAAEFTPNAPGLWYMQITTQVDDVFDCHVKAGPPTDDWLIAITEDVWSEFLPGSYASGTAGSLVAKTADDVALIAKALIMANLTAVVPGSTSTIIHTAASQVDDFYNGLTVVVYASAGSVARRVVDFSTLDGAITLNSSLPFDPDDGDQVVILGIPGEVVLSEDSVALAKLCDIHNVMGLDPEDPLCISKTGQKTNRTSLTHTEVGKKVIVQRVT